MEHNDPHASRARKVAPAVGHSDREVPLPRVRDDAPDNAPADPAPLFAALPSVLRRYTEEIDREIAAVERGQRRATNRLTAWEPLSARGLVPDPAGPAAPHRAGRLYRLTVEQRWRSRTGERVVLKVTRADRMTELRGEVRAIAPGGHLLDVEVCGPLPEPAPDVAVILTVDSAWLEHRLRACVEAIGRSARRIGPERVSRALRACGWTERALPALEAWTPALPRELETLADHPSLHLLNAGQLSAVRRACGSGDVQVVIGPPGTGKTSVVAVVVWQLVRQGERVLLMAPSNGAADIAIERIIQWCADDPQLAMSLRRGLVQRWGAGTARGTHSEFSLEAIVETLVRERRALLAQEECWDGTLRVRPEGCQAATHDTVAADAEWANCPLPLRVAPEHRVASLSADSARYRRAVERAVKSECRVVVTTTAAPLCLASRLRQFDPLSTVFDEGSMVNGAQTLIGAVMARERVIQVGDPRQLGAVLRAPHTSLLSAGAMHSVTGTRCRRRGETSKLTTQYRMEQSICELVNRAFPSDVVMETAPERLRVPRPEWQRHASVVLVDTSFMNPVSRSATGGSVETPVHVDVVARLWHAVRASAADAGPSVAIVTPYRAQCDALASARIDPADISTAHGWQGDEADVVMLSLDECSRDTMHFLGANGVGRHEGERLLYVGATRPKHQLVVLGPVTHLMAVGSDITRSFLRELVQAGEAITPGEFYSA